MDHSDEADRSASDAVPGTIRLPSRDAGEGRGRRFLFFSNELIGLGHLRRTLSVANRRAETEPESSSLIVTGSPVVPWFGMPPRVDILKLPGWTRDESGERRSGGLALDVSGLHAGRAGIGLPVAPSCEARWPSSTSCRSARAESSRTRSRRCAASPAAASSSA